MSNLPPLTPTDLANFIPGATSGLQTTLMRWRAARGRVLSGAGSAQIACVGDSKTLGVGANGSAYAGCKSKSYPRQLAATLNARGLPSFDRSIFGDGRIGLANFLTADTRVTVGAGWSEFGSDSLGGFMFGNSTDTSSFSFAPGIAFDTIDIFDTTNSAYAQQTVNVDGGATLATIAPGGGSTIFRKTTVACTRGIHTVNLQRTGAGANSILSGIATRDSTTPSVSVHNLGSSGAQAGSPYYNTSSNVWSPLPALTALAADLYIIDLGTNEWINGIAPATYSTNMGGIITTCLAVGDVILLAPSFSSTSIVSQANQTAIVAASHALATQYNVPLIDNSLRVGAYAAAYTLGMYFTGDTTHPSGTQYADEAQRIAAVLLT